MSPGTRLGFFVIAWIAGAAAGLGMAGTDPWTRGSGIGCAVSVGLIGIFAAIDQASGRRQ